MAVLKPKYIGLRVKPQAPVVRNFLANPMAAAGFNRVKPHMKNVKPIIINGIPITNRKTGIIPNYSLRFNHDIICLDSNQTKYKKTIIMIGAIGNQNGGFSLKSFAILRTFQMQYFYSKIFITSARFLIQNQDENPLYSLAFEELDSFTFLEIQKLNY